MLEGLRRLEKEIGFQDIKLNIDSNVVVQNILDYGQGSIIGMQLV